MTASSSRRRNGSAATRKSWPPRSKKPSRRSRNEQRKHGNTGARIGRGSRSGRPGRCAAEGGADRHAVRPHRRNADHRRRAVPGNARLLRPGQCRGWGRGLYDQGGRDRQRVQGPAGGRGVSAPQQEGAFLMTLYGTPMTVALNQRLEEDKIATTSPGFGIAAAADGTRYPYLFPIAATYWSQGAAAVEFVKNKLGGNLKGKKIAYIFYDNPAGKEPLPIVEELQKQEGFELRTFAVPPPGVEVGAQVLDITQRYRPDFVIAHLFGRSPAAAIKAFKSNGYPLSKVVGLVWASSEADIDAAGGFGVADGYHAMQFAGAGDDYPVRQQIKAMYKKAGKEPLDLMDKSTVYYNRGLLQAAIHVEGIRNALKANGGKLPTGTEIKNGFEQIRDFTLGGLVPPLEIT